MTNHCGNEPFALQVLGDSMAPEFENGHIIVIDPEAVVKDGAFVFAVHDGEYIFRQLQIKDDKYYLFVKSVSVYLCVSVSLRCPERSRRVVS